MHRRTKFHKNRSNGFRDIAFYNFQNGGRPPSWIFKSLIFWSLVTSGGLICAIMQNFVKIGQTVSEILRFFDFQDGCRPPSWILKFLVLHQFGRAKMHHHTKFHQNWSNDCRDIAFNVFQNSRPLSWIFLNWFLCSFRRANVHQHAKFCKNRSNRCWNIAIYTFFQDGGRPPFWICGANFGPTHNVCWSLSVCDLSSHVSVRPWQNFCDAFLQAGLTNLDKIWHDGEC